MNELNRWLPQITSGLHVRFRASGRINRQIDEAVYELYGLTAEEIKIVEGEK